MAGIYLISGPYGCGKSTLAAELARRLPRQAYLIQGDTFHAGFSEPADASISCTAWEDILRFNWDCIVDVARNALTLGMNVVIDYVVEDELPRMQALAAEYGAELHYIVLTASEDTLRSRLSQRGDAWLAERSLFLKAKLEGMTENQGHILDITGMSVEKEIAHILQRDFRI
ncbi:MAG: ATP-binding protein [Clostridia bacterium]|nr:ATP-binding protein [Clostridia bacterium]